MSENALIPPLKTLPKEESLKRRMQVTRRWYAIYTAPRAEKKVSDRFQQAGIEHYLPLQQIMRQWSDRKKLVTEPVIRGYLFVHVSPLQFKQVIYTYGALHFVCEHHQPAPIPDEQIQRLKFMVEGAEAPVEFTAEALKPGESVTVIRGPLQGLTGELVEVKGNYHVMIRLDKLGCALTSISLSSIRRP
jgi:transcription antitermination factor NusG